jgi:hypothetical protein
VGSNPTLSATACSWTSIQVQVCPNNRLKSYT